MRYIKQAKKMNIYFINSESGNQIIRNSPINIPGTIPEIHSREKARYPNKFLLFIRYLLNIQIKRQAAKEDKYIADIDDNRLNRNW
jgi:hypothetical protein